MDEALQARADDLFEEALGSTNAKDPREFYREGLREMKTSNPEGYKAAVEYYQSELIPAIAERGEDPLRSWQEYGCRLAELTIPGSPVEIDPSGVSHEYSAPTPPNRMILHIPEGTKGRAVVIGLPPDLSSAPRATYDLLVAGRQKLSD